MEELSKFFHIPLNETEKQIRFNILDPADPFIGRDHELDLLRLAKNKDFVVVIIGEAGIGKTDLALKYAQDFKEDIKNNIIFINATSFSTIMKSLNNLAKQIGIKTNKGDFLKIVMDVVNYFENKKTLLIIDNCEETNILTKYIPIYAKERKNINVILTSRDENWGRDYRTIRLHRFNKEESARYIFQNFDNSVDVHHVRVLNHVTDFLPLALNKSVTYIKNQILLYPEKTMDDCVEELQNMKRSENENFQPLEPFPKDGTRIAVKKIIDKNFNDGATDFHKKLTKVASEFWDILQRLNSSSRKDRSKRNVVRENEENEKDDNKKSFVTKFAEFAKKIGTSVSISFSKFNVE